ncbi:PREDICTED: ATP-dependent DNA helicase PIF1-like isoform X2 [Vollenhovia emeryi]|uniref:ATP-dependent DNA helicase PIF1-like isoform X1 n=1 Tax=Vollenhovia emeryi TaxID=411798 RepID=UPI0005F4FFAA|nr:PREDICTED: ATP-dependent DNA helicase PIF1-like isoform X1 [Vollenhovia emeryi]XP_011883982.1 PREDICTED: ATP-dependent DNA helicase PIF1-like isoform X2 [Vollenhovia emeryi]
MCQVGYFWDYPRKRVEYYKMDNGYYVQRRQRGYLINHYKNDVNTRPENYFFSLLLMCQSWRKLEDLKNGCDTYTESFHKIKLHNVEALQYHDRLEELKKAHEDAVELVKQQLDEEKQNVSQDDPDNPIGVQNIEAGEAMQDFKDLGDKLVQEIDVSEMISKLNADQRRVFDRVIDTVLLEDKSLLRLYVSVEGGTGKSFLIRTIKCWIKQNLNKDTAVAAPTGIATFNIDGLTVHRLLQLPVEHGQTPKYKQLSDYVSKVLRADLKDVILFIIDEVSMISNLSFMYIHLRLSQIFDTINCDDGWFGRKHILLFGDLLQLPPVHEDLAFVRLSDEKFSKYLGSLCAPNIWATLFNYDELTINMRQQGDGSYRELLSRIRVGLVIKSDYEILESRKISFKGVTFETRLHEVCNYIDNLPSDAVCLLPTCHMCDVLNAAMLNRIASKEILLTAEDAIQCTKYIKKKVEKLLLDTDDDNSRTAGLSKLITIKIGAKIMIRRNIDASLGLVNGTIAKVTSVVQDISSNYIEKIKVLVPSGSEYLIERVNVKFKVMDRAYVIRKQFPISLSYGITIHKSQGLSLQNAIMDIGNCSRIPRGEFAGYRCWWTQGERT